jgi:hypothetical protein
LNAGAWRTGKAAVIRVLQAAVQQRQQQVEGRAAAAATPATSSAAAANGGVGLPFWHTIETAFL